MSASAVASARSHWPLERVLFLIAGSMVLASAVLAASVTPWFLRLTAFVGLNQLIFVMTGTCGMAAILRRVFGLEGCSR